MSSWLWNISHESISFMIPYGSSMPMSELPRHVVPLTHPVPVRVLQPLCSPTATPLPLVAAPWSQVGCGRMTVVSSSSGSGLQQHWAGGWGTRDALDTHLEETPLV